MEAKKALSLSLSELWQSRLKRCALAQALIGQLAFTLSAPAQVFGRLSAHSLSQARGQALQSNGRIVGLQMHIQNAEACGMAVALPQSRF